MNGVFQINDRITLIYDSTQEFTIESLKDELAVLSSQNGDAITIPVAILNIIAKKSFY